MRFKNRLLTIRLLAALAGPALALQGTAAHALAPLDEQGAEKRPAQAAASKPTPKIVTIIRKPSEQDSEERIPRNVIIMHPKTKTRGPQDSDGTAGPGKTQR